MSWWMWMLAGVAATPTLIVFWWWLDYSWRIRQLDREANAARRLREEWTGRK